MKHQNVQASQRQRYTSLQLARAFAAVAVIIVHVWGVTDNSDSASKVSLFSFGQAGVDQFFIISGFIISLVITRPQTSGKFLFRRAMRIYPFYWAFTLAWVAMLWVAHKPMPTAGITLWSMAALPLKGSPVLGVGWSLEHEAIFYGIAALMIGVGRKDRLLEVIALLAAVSVAANLLFPQSVSGFKDWHLLSLYHVQFMLGAALFRYRRHVVQLPYLPLLISGLLLFPVSAAILHVGYDVPIPTQPEGTLGILRVSLFGAAGSLTLAGLLAMEHQKANWMGSLPARAVEELGNASYGLYLSHPLIYAATAFTVARFWPRELPPVLAIVVALVLALTFALMWYRYIEAPLLRRVERRPVPPVDGPA